MEIEIIESKKYVAEKLGKALIRPTSINDFEQSIIDCLINLYASPFTTIEGIAGHIGINERTLRTSCIGLFGRSPKSLLTYIRVSHAQFLLSTGMEVSLIARNSGFKSVKHLEKQLSCSSERGN